jgi:hypothetical protein
MPLITASILTVSLFLTLQNEETLTGTENELKNAAWYYPEPLEKAKYIKNYVAFCKFSIHYSPIQTFRGIYAKQ